MIRPQREGRVDVGAQVLVGLPRQGEDEVHRDCFKGDRREGRRHRLGIDPLPAKDLLVLIRKGLDADADLRHARFLQRLQHLDRHIVRVKLKADPLGDDEVFAERVYDLLDAICRKRGRSAAEIQAGRLFSPRMLPADKVYFLNQRINIPLA